MSLCCWISSIPEAVARLTGSSVTSIFTLFFSSDLVALGAESCGGAAGFAHVGGGGSAGLDVCEAGVGGGGSAVLASCEAAEASSLSTEASATAAPAWVLSSLARRLSDEGEADFGTKARAANESAPVFVAVDVCCAGRGCSAVFPCAGARGGHLSCGTLSWKPKVSPSRGASKSPAASQPGHCPPAHCPAP